MSAGAGSLYAALLEASGGSVTVEGRVFGDPVALREFLGQRMRDEPLAEWPRVAPLISEYLGMSLLVLEPGGRFSAYGSGPALVVARIAGVGEAPRWVGVRAALEGAVLGGLSPAQAVWAAAAGMVFVGRRGGGDLFDGLVAAGRASKVEALSGDPQALRQELARRMRTDAGLAGSDDWMLISDQYVQAAVSARGGEAQPDRLAVEEAARRRLEDGEAWQEIIAGVSAPGGDQIMAGGLLPVLVRRYLGVSVQVLDADGRVRLDGAGLDGEGRGVTVARVAGDDVGVLGGVWQGLAPVGPVRARGAGTRPAEVAGGFAGGWSASAVIDDLAEATEAVGPAEPVMPVGPVPAGVSAAQREWVLGHHRRFVEVPAGPDGFFDALVAATDGGFTTASGVFVADGEVLRRLLAEEIDRIVGADLGLWLTVHTIYADVYRRREQSAGDEDARALSERIDARIDEGRALGDIVASIADPGYWPELAEQVAPYFANRLGLAVRVVAADGVVDRYGRGRPVYLASVAGEGPRRWVALPRVATRFAAGSALSAPNRSDPVLVRLSQAVDARKNALTATAPAADGAPDPVVAWLRGARARWLAGSAGPGEAVADMADALVWSPGQLESMVTGLGLAAGLDGEWSWGGSGDVGAGLSVSFAVALVMALFTEQGGIGLAQAGEHAAGQAGVPSGIGADAWMQAPSLADLIGAVPPGAVALFLDGAQAWVIVDTTSGRRLVEFASDRPPAGRVLVPAPDRIASLDSSGLTLVIAPDGHTIGSERLGEAFAPATGWDAKLTFTASRPGSLRQDADSVADAVPGISPRQNAWADTHQAQFITTPPGANSFFEAALAAGGGRLTTKDGDQELADVAGLRQALAGHMRQVAAAPGGLGDQPLLAAAFAFAARERILEEFLDDDVSRLDPRAVDDQIKDHLRTGAAADYTAHAIATPGHWEDITQLLAPNLLAGLIGLNLLVLEPDGRVRGHGDPAARRLILARTSADTAAAPGWAAVVPHTPGQGTEPFTGVTIDVQADAGSRPAEHTEALQPAVLNDHQSQVADEQALRTQPTQTDTDSFYSAVLTAAGGILIHPDTFDPDRVINTPARLRQTLAGLIRERPDALEATTRQQTRPNPQDLDTEQIIDALTNPTHPTTDRYARDLIGSYFGELRVIEPDGTIHTQGTGGPITIAPTTDEYGHTHWAALVPPAGHESLPHVQSPALPALPSPPLDFDQPPTPAWDPEHYKLQQPGTPHTEDPWRSSTFCLEENGVRACVSVALITLIRPTATNLTAT
ncbi:hypothetical protein [Actinoallomurus sp. NPDC050550]|uniref:hypothetical protein n=1 Tax=Actinoallomurus sp. NPDC050550 TaxID=3154937 RepID=UPI0033FC15B2